MTTPGTNPDREDRALERHLVGVWQRAGYALAEVRRAEVAAMTDAEALATTLDLLDAMDRLPPRPLRPSSGLVDQQRIFARAQRER